MSSNSKTGMEKFQVINPANMSLLLPAPPPHAVLVDQGNEGPIFMTVSTFARSPKVHLRQFIAGAVKYVATTRGIVLTTNEFDEFANQYLRMRDLIKSGADVILMSASNGYFAVTFENERVLFVKQGAETMSLSVTGFERLETAIPQIKNWLIKAVNGELAEETDLLSQPPVALTSTGEEATVEEATEGGARPSSPKSTPPLKRNAGNKKKM